jgi:hypothetical protein
MLQTSLLPDAGVAVGIIAGLLNRADGRRGAVGIEHQFPAPVLASAAARSAVHSELEEPSPPHKL